MNLKEKIKMIPPSPGCYLMKDTSGCIIYIGKAKDLKKRVRSYFLKRDHDEKTFAMVSHVADIDFIVTDNEVEALLLEARLIRQHQPPYNIDLRENVRYAYLKVTDDKFPRIVTARKVSGKGRFYGPYPSGRVRALSQRLLQRLFKIRICHPMPKKACLLFHLGQCTAPCIKKVDENAYAEQIRRAEMLLKGKTAELIDLLETEMRRYSRALNFEHAQAIKEQIRAIQRLSEKQKVELPKAFDQHVINFLEADGSMHIQIFQIQKGVVSHKVEMKFEGTAHSFGDFIKQYYFLTPIPREIILPMELDDQAAVAEYLSKIKDAKVIISVPKKGYKAKMLAMIKKNIELKFTHEPMAELQSVLKIAKVPDEIDCFDISNISGTHATGSCVRFSLGKPNKRFYRHFRIKRVFGSNDFAMMIEVVERRYSKTTTEDIPDLIVIDGGRGQLSAALSVLHGLKLHLPIIGLAKKFEEIYTTWQEVPIRLPTTSAALHLLQRIRDEAHRFAITYHKRLRSRAMTQNDSPKAPSPVYPGKGEKVDVQTP
jgi:excinuclease ABC subunit C